MKLLVKRFDKNENAYLNEVYEVAKACISTYFRNHGQYKYQIVVETLGNTCFIAREGFDRETGDGLLTLEAANAAIEKIAANELADLRAGFEVTGEVDAPLHVCNEWYDDGPEPILVKVADDEDET